MSLQSPAGVTLDYASPGILPERFGIGDLLAVGFGTAVAMWAVGYIGRMPGVHAAPQIVMACWFLCLVAGGYCIGRYSARGAKGGIITGLISALLNLLILGSLLTEHQSSEMKHSAVLWLAGFFAISGVLSGVGGILGTTVRRSRAATGSFNGKAAFAWVAVASTLLLITAGGLVTGFNAGLAVPDWPTSFQMNMFFFPLSRMTHGIYYEHAHRLLGSLVGFTCLTLAIYMLCVERRRWLTALCWLAGSMVAVQAMLGGVRVFDKSRPVAVVHGVLAQLVLATLVSIAVFSSRRFATRRSSTVRPGAAVDHHLTRLLVAALAIQLVLGALVRHENFLVLLHIAMAVVVAVLVLVVGMRCVALNDHLPLLRRLGVTLLILVGIQVIAGINALVAGGYGDLPADAAIQPTVQQAIATTLHQTNGAILMACAVAIMIWSRRLLVEPQVQAGGQSVPRSKNTPQVVV